MADGAAPTRSADQRAEVLPLIRGSDSEHARVRTYRKVLIERAATDRLKVIVRRGDGGFSRTGPGAAPRRSSQVHLVSQGGAS